MCACMYAFMSVCCRISVCVRGYVATCTVYVRTYSPHVLVYILTTCTCLHTHYMYLSTYSLHLQCLHTHYMYLSTYSLHVLVYILTTCTCLHTHYIYNVYILTTCTCLHTHYMYLSTYSLHIQYLHTHYMYLSTYLLHVLVYILTTCTCLHTQYMYLSTGGQSEVISTDPKIAPVNDQPSVYGELTDSGQMVQNYNC